MSLRKTTRFSSMILCKQAIDNSNQTKKRIIKMSNVTQIGQQNMVMLHCIHNTYVNQRVGRIIWFEIQFAEDGINCIRLSTGCSVMLLPARLPE